LPPLLRFALSAIIIATIFSRRFSLYIFSFQRRFLSEAGAICQRYEMREMLTRAICAARRAGADDMALLAFSADAA